MTSGLITTISHSHGYSPLALNFGDEAPGCFAGANGWRPLSLSPCRRRLFKVVRPTHVVSPGTSNQLKLTEEQAAQKEDFAMGILRGIGSSCMD